MPRAFAILQLVVAADSPVGVRELARRSGLARSSVSRHLGVLADLGMVERTGAGEAIPGPSLATLNPGSAGGPPLVAQRLRPLVAGLVDRFGESAVVGVDDGDQVLYLEGEIQPGAVRVPDETGHGYPFHLVAAGVVMMGHWGSDRLDRYLDDELARATRYSVVEPSAALDRIRRTRADGYVWAEQELDLEVNGLAVPVFGADGDLLAAVSLYGPTYRLNPIDRPGLGRELADLVAERAAPLLN